MHTTRQYVPPLLADEPPLVLHYLRAALVDAGAHVLPTERDTLAWRGRDGSLAWARLGHAAGMPPGYRSLDLNLLPRPIGLPPGAAHSEQRQEIAPLKVWRRPRHCRACVAALLDLIGWRSRRAA